MESQSSQDRTEAPETIGALYASASFQSTAYRDFSASRIDARARFRYRMLRQEEGPAETAPAAPPTQQADVSGIPEIPASSTAPSGFQPRSEILSSSPPQRELAAPAAGVEAEPAAAPAPAQQELQPSVPQEPEPSAPPVPSRENLRPRPQWLDAGPASPGGGKEEESETLQHAKERVASRWFALKGLFAGSPPEERQSGQRRERRVPVIAVFSFAGGVGKTSLTAALGRALASYGERVLLADTAPFGLLPFYFGARDLKPGVVRTFAPPANSIDAPVCVVTLDAEDADETRGEDTGQDKLVETLLREGQRSQRILADVQTASEDGMRRLLPLMPMVLAPLLPEMNSVVSVRAIESVFSGEAEEQKIRPIYLLNQFDASLPLHVDIREILEERLGDRLLPFVIRRSPAVSEALAEGMTVFDYAPNSSVAEDYLRLADWLRSASAAAADQRGARWSERESECWPHGHTRLTAP